MQTITQMVNAGDPIPRLHLPKALLDAIQQSAKKNKRRPQDEFIKRLHATFKAEHNFIEIQKKVLPHLIHIYQN